MNQRLKEILNVLKERRIIRSYADFAREVGIDKADLSKMMSGNKAINQLSVGRILVKFPQINKKWLLTGVGEMFNNPSYSKTATPLINAEESATAFIGDNNKVNADQTIAMLVAEVAAQRRVTEKVLEQNSELLAMIAANNKK